jgi:hypothetical protein
MPDVLKLNFLFTLLHKAYEADNKQIADYYDFGRYTANR